MARDEVKDEFAPDWRMSPMAKMATEAILRQWPLVMCVVGVLFLGQYRLAIVEERTEGQGYEMQRLMEAQGAQVASLTALIQQNAIAIARLQEIVRIQAGTWESNHQRGG